MIEVKKIVSLVRMKEKDFDELRYSDYEIISSLNEALRYIVQSQAMMNSDFLEKARFYHEHPEDNFALLGISLPDDYLTLVCVSRLDGYKMRPTEISNIPNEFEYKITAERIFTGSKSFVLAYKKSIDEVETMEDSIDLPPYCLDFVVKITRMVLTQAEQDIMMDVIESTTKSIIPRRRYAGAETKMPFKI